MENKFGGNCSVYILGTTQFSEEIADLVDQVSGLSLAGFVENMKPEKRGESLLGHSILWIDDLSGVPADSCLLCGIGTTQRSLYVEQARQFGLQFATLIHSTAYVSSKSQIGSGAILSVNSIVAGHSQIGEHVIVNRAAIIGHHTNIGNYVTIGPGANIAGRCVVESGTYVGMGAIVIDGIQVGSNSIIGAGAVVTRDVPDNVMVVGVPAKVVKEGVNGR